jgi:archaellum component FlaF (FlaF/FlaG flagellin family)
MGQSTVVATAFTAIMFVAGVSILIMSTVSGFSTLSEALTSQSEQRDIVLNERIEFGDWLFVDSSTLRINASNVGSTSILINSFDKMDLIASYNDGTGEQTDWISYDQSETSSSYWSVNRVFFRNQQQDLINPISLTGTVRGAWDSEETLELEIHLDEATPTFEYLTLITPAGVKARSSLTKDYDMGTATVVNGTSVVVVSHLIDQVPENVMLTPTSQIGTEYWVDNVDSDSFEIHLSSIQASDITFYWHVE